MHRIVFGTKSGLTVNVTQGYLSQLPVKIIPKERQKEIIGWVDEILRVKRRELALRDKETDEKAELKEKFDTLEAGLNNLIFKVYGLTEAEKKTIACMLTREE